MKGVNQQNFNNPENDGLEIFISTCSIHVLNLFENISSICSLCFEGFLNWKKKQIKKAVSVAGESHKKYSRIKKNVPNVLEWLNNNKPEVGKLYIEFSASLNEAAASLNEMVASFANHFYNSHKPFTGEQVKEFIHFESRLTGFLNTGINSLEPGSVVISEKFSGLHKSLISELKKMGRNQVSRISLDEVSSRNSLLFFTFLKEMEKLINALNQAVNLFLEMQSQNNLVVNEGTITIHQN